MDKLSFVRVDFDSLLGQGLATTNDTYTETVITGSRAIVQTITRNLIVPDIVFGASDLGDPGPSGMINGLYSRSPGWLNNSASNSIFTQNQAPNGGGGIPLGGPGQIIGTIEILFNKVGPLGVNAQPNFVGQLNAFLSFFYGSFDGTTNPPVIYPLGTSIKDLENRVLGN